jgi:hypothetical protein
MAKDRARFGEAALTAPHAIQWLSDNGPQYTATATVLYAHDLGLAPITTPAYSPQSNGLAEAFVGTFKRDYLDGADLRDAVTVLAQLGGWIDDYTPERPTRRSGCAARSTTGGAAHAKLLAVSRRLGSTPSYSQPVTLRRAACDTTIVDPGRRPSGEG